MFTKRKRKKKMKEVVNTTFMICWRHLQFEICSRKQKVLHAADYGGELCFYGCFYVLWIMFSSCVTESSFNVISDITQPCLVTQFQFDDAN